MLRLRELQQKAQGTQQGTTNNTDTTNNTQSPPPSNSDSSSGTGYVLKKQNSGELHKLRASKKSNETIFMKKRGGRRNKNNAAELRAQKGNPPFFSSSFIYDPFKHFIERKNKLLIVFGFFGSFFFFEFLLVNFRHLRTRHGSNAWHQTRLSRSKQYHEFQSNYKAQLGTLPRC
jgi:hypothetical protein